MSTKIYKQQDLFEKGQRQKSSMAAVSEMHSIFDMSQTDTMRNLQKQIERSTEGTNRTSVYSVELERKNAPQEQLANNQLTEQMYQQIHDIGYKAAQEVYERKLNEVQRQVKNSDDKAKLIDQTYQDAIRQMQMIRNEFENSLNLKAKELIIKSCEKVLQSHLKDPGFVHDYLSNFISQFREEQDVILRLSQDMYARVESNISELEELNPKVKLHIATDLSLPMFGCVIETENQKLDLRLDNQLSNLRNVIEGL